VRRSAGAPHEFAEVSEVLFLIEKALSGDKDQSISRLRRELIKAGYFRADAVFWFYLARLSLALVFAGAAFLLLGRLAPGASIASAGAIVVPASLIGLVVPGFFLSVRQRQLRQQCRNGFPNFLDLLVVCAEGGLTPRAGIERVSRELTPSYPYLGANLFLMSLELRAGRPLVEAMDNLGKRVQIDEVRSLGSLLQQTEELGTKLSDALRVFSEDMRARRLMRAEEKAHGLPVKLVLPLAFFVFPVMLMVVLLPVLVRIHKAFL
jgi:tight adherence protein C